MTYSTGIISAWVLVKKKKRKGGPPAGPDIAEAAHTLGTFALVGGAVASTYDFSECVDHH